MARQTDRQTDRDRDIKRKIKAVAQRTHINTCTREEGVGEVGCDVLVHSSDGKYGQS